MAGLHRSFLVDAARRVVESSREEPPVGEVVTSESWLGCTVLGALSAAVEGAPSRRLARDLARDTHWVVEAEILVGVPWMARITIVDATLAVLADRAVLGRTVVHALRNSAFGLQCVVDALELEQPTGPAFDAYIEHLRAPVRQIAASMNHLANYVRPPRLALVRVALDEFVERAFSRLAPPHPPGQVRLTAPGMHLLADEEELSRVLAVMLEVGDGSAGFMLAIDRVESREGSFARVVAERASGGALSSPAAWDLTGAASFDVLLRRGACRAIVIAHGGRLEAGVTDQGRERLAILLPLLADP